MINAVSTLNLGRLIQVESDCVTPDLLSESDNGI